MNTSMSTMKIRHIIGWILVSSISLEFLSRASLLIILLLGLNKKLYWLALFI
ncbi:hypothetical protein AAHB50_00780 [Bacillus toyonensis]